MMPGFDDPRAETEAIAGVRPGDLHLRGVEAELVQTLEPLLEPEALVGREHLLVRQLAPEPVVAREHVLGELERVLAADVEQLAEEILARELEVVPALPVGELVVQLSRLGVEEVRGEPARVTPEERVRE